MDEELKAIGVRIKEMRRERNITQKGLADALNISHTNMCNIENGKTAVTIQNLLKLKRIFACHMEEFFVEDTVVKAEQQMASEAADQSKQEEAAARKDLSSTLSSDEAEALAVLGVEKTYHASFPNIKMNTVPHLELVQFIEGCIEDWQADAIITHHPADTNNDHVMTSYAVQAACRLFQRRDTVTGLKELLYMEVPSSTEWSCDTSANRFIGNWCPCNLVMFL